MLYAIDTETALIVPGLAAPPLACMSVQSKSAPPELFDHLTSVDVMHALLDSGVTIIGHNIAYDLAVLCAKDPTLLPKVFKALDEGRIKDTMIREKLADIARGRFRMDFDHEGNARRIGYDLDSVARAHTNVGKADDQWRLRYGELIGVPLEQWPKSAREYALTDAGITFAAYESQEEKFRSRGYLVNEDAQLYSAFALRLMSCRGVRTDAVAIAKLKQGVQSKMQEIFVELVYARVISTSGSRVMARIKQLITEAFNGDPPKTDKGNVKTDEETLFLAAPKHPVLKKLATYTHLQKISTTYAAKLEEGTFHPINANFNELVETGRTSCSKPNLQNPPRAPGVRECYVPRPGFVFCSVDFKYLELCTLAQACYELVGFSVLGDSINAGIDPHIRLGAQMLGCTYEAGEQRHKAKDKEFKGARQNAKKANFGLPGGMGLHRFIESCAEDDIIIDEVQAKIIIAAWFEAWPEMKPYFAHVKNLVGEGNCGNLVQLYSGRIRGLVGFTDGANSYFQGLAADGAKAALCRLTKEAYSVPSSPFYGCRPVLFLHDEVIAEIPIWKQHAAAMYMAQVMREEMQKWTPRVKIGADPALMMRWLKDAEAVYDANGELIPWEPKVEEAKAA